jgi:hypothetical protein
MKLRLVHVQEVRRLLSRLHRQAGQERRGFWQEGESLFFRQALLEGIFR